MLQDYKCILIDRPGCGLSEAVPYKNFSEKLLIELIISTIEEVLNYFDFDKVFIVGSSFGGLWAIKYAINKPETIHKLVLEGCPAMVEGMLVPNFMKSMTMPVLKWLIPRLHLSKSYARKILKEIGHTYSIENNLFSAEFFDWYLSLSNNTDTMKNDSGIINILLRNGKLNPEFILTDSEIQKITVPTLWLWGSDDPFGGIDIGKRIHSKMKNSEFIGFENSGHLPWLDKPADHAMRIKSFFELQY